MAVTQLIGEVLDEKYRIDRQLGKGGMGAVYLATHLGTERPVAVKIIAPQFMKHEEFIERFKREARAAGRLRHPNVVDVTDFGFARLGAERVAYLVMEYLDGCTLAEVLAEESRLPVGWVVDILEQACSAVDEAHRQGIIHRDLKPDNIWLEPNRRGGYTAKVLDFGIAKLADTAPPANSNTVPAKSLTASATHARPRASAPDLESPTLLVAASTTASESTDTLPLSSSATATPPDSPPSEFLESATQMLPASSSIANADASEAGTQMFPSTSTNEQRAQGHRTTTDSSALQTASSESLTRVGSILGTPLYMSPEQCRSETHDARSDVYSLGVIAYQMLCGRTPFAGDLHAVMKQHIESPPPPLVEKKIPKKVAGVVLSALAKNPDERPQTAAAFASSVRAHSEGAGTLLRHALALYSEHLPTFLRTALLVYSPLIFFTALQVMVSALSAGQVLSKTMELILSSMASLLVTVSAFASASVLLGVMTRMVTQLMVAPLRPIHFRTAFAALKKKLWPVLSTTVLVGFMVLLGLILCIVPGLILMVNYCLVAPVVMMEDVRGRAALKRAKALAQRSKRTVVMIVFIQFGVPFLAATIGAFLIASVLKAFGPLQGKANMFSIIHQIVLLPINILMGSLSTIITALLYLKTRQAGGEALKESLGVFDDEDAAQQRNWQLRMRQRLLTPTRTRVSR